MPKQRRPPIPVPIQLRLWVTAAGRCEFNGCNQLLLRDDLTLREANYADIAHIVSWTLGGPRGSDPLPIGARNAIGNLMLACQDHHRLIDNKNREVEFPAALLREMKESHERRIERLTAIHPDAKTTVIRMQTQIGGHDVDIARAQIDDAVYPRYADGATINIDLRNPRSPDNACTWAEAASNIDARLKRELASRTGADTATHFSVFALAPIPLLVHLGNQLSNKIPADLYQRHRNPDSWTWRSVGEIVSYRVARLATGTDRARVAVLLSLSGSIARKRLPQELRDVCSLYEITLDGRTPEPTFLARRESLFAFINAYHELIGKVRADLPDVQEIHLFPAVPAPIAVACGRELLPKVHPMVVVYDDDKAHAGFRRALEINSHDSRRVPG